MIGTDKAVLKGRRDLGSILGLGANHETSQLNNVSYVQLVGDRHAPR